MKKIALITGIAGQDGSYLANLLLSKNYEVHGIVRSVALEDEAHKLWRIKELTGQLILHSASLESYASLVKIIQKIRPDELYHLAAQSFVSYSFKDEFSTINNNINGTHHVLSAIKEFSPKTKFYFAGSSEMFGRAQEVPQNEKTRFYPRSAYGISKVAGFELSRNYREAYNLFCSSGILFNHESPRRGLEFVTRKITFSLAKIKFNLQKKIVLGNIKSKRDWGHSRDYVDAMWLMLQQKKPDDFVISTGVQHSVEDFAKLAFSLVDLDYKKFIEVDDKLFRPTETESLVGDSSYAKKVLGWEPKVKFVELVKEMLDADMAFVKKMI
jgi:GDPmannose 4,6-dehydratase